MGKKKTELHWLSRLSAGTLSLTIIGFVFPVLILVAFGIIAIIEHGYTIHFAIALLISILVVAIPRWFMQQAMKKQIDEMVDSEAYVVASGEWSEQEKQVWQDINNYIESLLSHTSDWVHMRQHSFSVATLVAKAFNKKELDFTVLEGLKLSEEISRRYRVILKENIPASDLVKVSQIKWLYDVNERYGERVIKYGSLGKKIWRASRLVNPASAVVHEIRGKIMDSVTAKFSESLQLNAKRALLQEIAATCIELYSGRFSFDENDIEPSQISADDTNCLAADLEPLRVSVVGQVSSGKSSLINALKEELVAEVDILPATDGVTVYRCSLVDDVPLHLIDTPGLDGNEKILSMVLHQTVQSDLVIWLLKANQSSRELDNRLKAKFETYFQDPENLSHKKPLLIGVLNQVDKLNPISDWVLPLKLENPQTAKEKTIAAALRYNSELLELDRILPLSISKNRPHYGLEAIESEIENLFDHAKNVQKNRQRNEAKGKNSGLKNQGKRLFNASKVIAKNLV